MGRDPNEFNLENPDSAGEHDDHGLPHWTEPGTGKLPRINIEEDDDMAAWSSLTNSGPRWADDEPGESTEAIVSQPAPAAPKAASTSIGSGNVEDDFFAYESGELGEVGQRRQNRQSNPREQFGDGARKGIDDLFQRLATAAVLAGVAVLCMLIGKAVTLLLVAVILGLAASEFFVSLRRVGYQPATLLGLTATVALPLAVYWRGEPAIGVVLFLTIVFGALWYLLGVNTERPVPNLGVTILGVVYIGVMGSFAALLLDTEDGIGLFLTAVLLAVGYDIGGYFVGRAIGRSPLSTASPNKTVEGLCGGMISTVAVGLVVVGIVGIDPFGGQPFGTFDAVLVAIVAAVAAPIGDLTESLMKRDLGLKDMGSILPGHGGILDRFDALLFVFPTVYFMVRLLA